jgi:hypothetical protein
MIRAKEFIMMFSLVAVLACSSVAGTEPNGAHTPLPFEVSSTELPAPWFNTVYPHPGVPAWNGTVTYAAGLARNASPYFLNYNSLSFIEYARSLGISEQQRGFLARTHGGLEGGPVYAPPEDPNSPQFLLYAVSLDDAKKTAEAYLRFATASFNDAVRPVQAEVKKSSEKLADEQQKLPEANQAYEAAKKAFEGLQKQVPYRDDKQALDAAAELDKMLNTAQVDIAGIQAMLQAIQNHLTSLPSNNSNEAVKSKLEVMFVEESISLKAAEARKRMATTLRKQADSYIDLKAASERAEVEKDRLSHDVSLLPDMIRKAQEKLAAKMQQEPKIINNKVFIYPVRQESPSVPQPPTPGSNQP